VPALLYLALRRIFELFVLIARSRDRKELEILVLRHELSVLRRQAVPRYQPRDRALLAALSRALPRAWWSAFAVRPETLIRWHRSMVSRRWTYERRGPGRPRLDADLVALVLRLARENRAGVIGASSASSRSSDARSRRRRSAMCSALLGSRRRRAAAVPRGGSSSASRRRAWSRATSSPSRPWRCDGSTSCSSSNLRPAGCIWRLHQQPTRPVGRAAGAQPADRSGRAATSLAARAPRPRLEVQRGVR